MVDSVLSAKACSNCKMKPMTSEVGGETLPVHILGATAARRRPPVINRLLRLCAAAWLGLVALSPALLQGATLPTGFIETDIFGFWPEVAGVIMN